MQTIFDAMIKDLILVGLATFANGTLIHINFGVAWNPTLAKIALISNFFLAFCLFCQVFMTVLVRYLNIFHSGLISDWNEDIVVPRSRLTIWILAAFCTSYETLENDYGQGPIYEFMIKKPEENTKQNRWVTMESLVLSVVLFVLFVHFRIEMYKRQSLPNNATHQDVANNIGIIRVSTFLALIVIGITMTWFVASVFVTDHAVHSARIHIVSSMLLYNVFPMLIIKRSPKINAFWKQKCGHQFTSLTLTTVVTCS